jgi:hypothetical protein
MKTLREELIDFLRWYRAEWSIPEYIKDEYSVDDYLFEKSNNSSTSEKSDCDHEWINRSFDHFGFPQEQICDKCGAKQSVP